MGKRVQNFNLKNLETKVINLGYVGENVHTQIVIECSEVLWDYPNAVASMVVQPPRGDLYPVEVTREENNIIWEITASDVVYAGSGRVQLTFTNNGEIVKSAVGTTRISGSIEATGEAPEPLQNWMDQAEETAHQIALTAKDEVIEHIQDAAEEARESIPADYTELSDDVTSLKSALDVSSKNTNEGYETLATYATFRIGGLSNGEIINNSKRVSSETIIQLNHDVTFLATDGWRIGFQTYADGVYTDLGWKTVDFTLTAGTAFKCSISKVPEEKVDVNLTDYVNAIKFKSVIKQQIDSNASDTASALSLITGISNLDGVEVDYTTTEAYPIAFRSGAFDSDGTSSATGNWHRTRYNIPFELTYDAVSITPPSGYECVFVGFTQEPSFANGADNSAILYFGSQHFATTKTFPINHDVMYYISVNTTSSEDYQNLYPVIKGLSPLVQKVLYTETEYAGTLGNIICPVNVSLQPESLTIVDEHYLLWAMDQDKMSSQNMRMYTFDDGWDKSATYNKRITHELGHMACMDSKNGTIIFTNATNNLYNGGTAENPGIGKLYIIEDFVSIFEQHYSDDTPMTLNDAITIELDPENCSAWTDRNAVHAVFAETNILASHNYNNNLLYLITSDMGRRSYNTKVHRIILGVDNNQLQYGTLLKTSGFNGTYDILDVYEGSSDGTDYFNDLCLFGGNIIGNVGEDDIRIQKFVLSNETNMFKKVERVQKRYANDGSLIGGNGGWSSGICKCKDGVIIGFSNNGGLFLYPESNLL